MGLETRERGGSYYYRKRRIGKRVILEYVGSGDLAYLANAFDEREHAQEGAKRRRVLQEHKEARDMGHGVE